MQRFAGIAGRCAQKKAMNGNHFMAAFHKPQQRTKAVHSAAKSYSDSFFSHIFTESGLKIVSVWDAVEK